MRSAESPIVPAPVPREPGAGPDGPGTGAFFDVDNTIIRGASAFHLAKGLYLRGFFRKRDLVDELGELVPVVQVDGVQQGYWRIDPARLRRTLTGATPRPLP